MSEPDGTDRNGSNVWHENGIRYAPRPPEFVPMAATVPPAGSYMNAQEAFIAANNGHHQSPMHHNQHQQQQQMHHHMAGHTSQPQQHMPQFIHSTDYTAPRNDGFTLLRTAHGDYLKVFYNNENAMNYNNYELFSNNSYSPHQMMKPQTQSHQAAPIAQETNFLNQLVENWTPNMSGTYKPFGEAPLPPPPMPSSSVSTANVSLPQLNTHTESSPMSSHSHVEHEMAAMSVARSQEPNEHVPPSVIAQPTRTNGNTNGSFLHDTAMKATVGGSGSGGGDVVKKPRMVAEVKPMRMSYSDVLSKNVFINKQNPSDASGNGANSTSSAGHVANGVSNANSVQPKSSKTDKNKSAFGEKKSSHSYDDKETSRKGASQSIYASQGAAAAKSSAASSGGGDGDRDNRNADNDGRQAKKKSGTAPVAANTSAKGTGRAKGEAFTKRRSQSDMISGSGPAQTSARDEADKSAQNSGFFYNITKNEPQAERSSGGAAGNTTKSYQHRKNVNKFSSASVSASRSSGSAGGGGSGSGSSKIDKTTQYQQKRAQKSRENSAYALAEKMIKTWLEYVLRFLNWLVCELVFDVIMLSCGIIVDRVAAGIDHTRQFFVSLRTELFTNSGRPSSYFWNLWLRFDKKFGKESKWAFWRRLFAKKKPPEPTPEFYKNGRLPQTGDEAMYSLLNCKGKDAYSILGVQADCSQEQIRKHYKKIAVLVHPDKNKQPGAEEAFKILQRAFELIGEPVCWTGPAHSHTFLISSMFCRKIASHTIKALPKH